MNARANGKRGLRLTKRVRRGDRSPLKRGRGWGREGGAKFIFSEQRKLTFLAAGKWHQVEEESLLFST